MQVFTTSSPDFSIQQDLHNAAFIASCAGNTEAGWRSTLAAIDWAFFTHQNGQVGEGLIEIIIAEWPIETLQK